MPTTSEPNWIPPEVTTARIASEARTLRMFRPALSAAESLAAAERMLEECRRLGRPLEAEEVRIILRVWLAQDEGQRRVQALTETKVEPVD